MPVGFYLSRTPARYQKQSLADIALSRSEDDRPWDFAIIQAAGANGSFRFEPDVRGLRRARSLDEQVWPIAALHSLSERIGGHSNISSLWQA